MQLPSTDPKRPYRDVGVLVAVALGIAVLHLPYGYYEFLRLVVCVAAVAIAASKPPPLLVLFSAVAAILFNPFWPIHLSKDIWRWLDGAFAVLFLTIGLCVRSVHPPRVHSGTND